MPPELSAEFAVYVADELAAKPWNAKQLTTERTSLMISQIHHCWNDDRNHWLTGSLQFILNKHGQFSVGGVFGSIDLYPRSLFL